MEGSKKSFCSRLQFVTTRKAPKKNSDTDSASEKDNPAENYLECDEPENPLREGGGLEKSKLEFAVNTPKDGSKNASHNPSSVADSLLKYQSYVEITPTQRVSSQTQLPSLPEKSEKSDDDEDSVDMMNQSQTEFGEGKDVAGGSESISTGSQEQNEEVRMRKPPLVKFTISVESNNEEDNTVFDLNVSQPNISDRKVFDEAKTTPTISKEAIQSSPRLRLSLSDDISSPECGNSPEIRYSLDRVRQHSGESSLTSTPTSSRRRRQTFCGGSYLSRRNLSAEQLDADYEDMMSVSSSEFSPGSTLSSLGHDRFTFHSVDELSDDGSSDSRPRESVDFSDDASVEGRPPHPVNKQLRIVTSVDRALFPHRRSPLTSTSKVLNFGRSSSENLEHLVFVDYLKRLKLQPYLKNFPTTFSLLDFKMTTEEELLDVYGVHDTDGRRALVKAIEAAREEEDQSDTDSLCEFHSSIPTSPLPSPMLRKCREEMPTIGGMGGMGGSPGGLRRLQRTLSEDTKQRRRESMPSSPTLTCPPPPLSHAIGALIEPTNLLRMRSSALGQSAPSLTGLFQKEPVSRKNSQRSNQRKSVVGPTTSPSLPPRCPSPHVNTGSPHESPRNLSPNTHGHFAFQAIRKCDGRRWSFASIPSSGYGTNTPGTGSNASSRYSSQERLHQFPSQPTDEEFHFLSSHFGSSNNMAAQDDSDLHLHANMRPRSRSLSSPARSPGVESEVVMMNSVYRERFPKATAQMVDKLKQFIDSNATLDLAQESDAVLCFLHYQVLELARDCLNKGAEKTVTKIYLYEMLDNLEKLLQDARNRSLDAYKNLYPLVKMLLLIVSRPLRLLECLEFDPEEFYMLLEAAEGQARQTIKTDIPQYIISKLGLAGDPLADITSVDQFHNINTGRQASLDATDGSGATDTEGGPEEQEVAALTKAKQPCEEDYHTIKLISNGAYAAVYLVRHKETRQRFAMKKICKQNLVLRNQIEQVFLERDILSFTDNPFVVSMYCSFETKKHLCMVMEYVEGGDCATLLKNVGCLPFEMARMYFAETVLALEYLHSYGVCHRDLKPDNLLITALGHVKLTDFGLSKIGLMSLTTNLYEDALDKDCKQFRDKQVFGTPEYIAPEVILRQGYGKPVDWWSMGIILYEFLVGCVPFFGDTPEELFSQVVNEEIQWPDEEDWQVRDDAKSLIHGLLEHDTLQRMGTGGAQEVKEHEFFSCVNWMTLLRQKSEFVPQLDHEEDTSYFDTRVDRYNHELEAEDTEGDEEDMLFHSFSSCSPRYSKVYNPSLEPLMHDELKERRRHSSADDFRARVLERRALERKDSNQSDGSEGSMEMLRRKDSVISDTTDNDTDGPARHPSVSDSSQTDSDSCHSPLVPRHKGAPPKNVNIPKFAISSEEDKPPSPKELSPVDEGKEGARPKLRDTRGEKSSLHKSVSENTLTLLMASGEFPPHKARSPGGSSTSSRDGSPSRDSPLTRSLKPPIILKRGARGFGFSFRSVRVYIGDSDVYTLQHIVTEVVGNSPSFEAGLRPGDLITHINEEAVASLLHTQVVHLLSSGNQVNIRAVPLDKTSIKEGVRRKGGKMARRSQKKRQQKEKAAEKKKSRNLLRRLSGKKTEPLYVHGVHAPPHPHHPPGRQQFSPLSRSISSGGEGTHAKLSRTPPLAVPWSPDSSQAGSSTSSSPSSSAPDSPATTTSMTSMTPAAAAAHFGRPSSLHVVKHKKTASLKSPHRRKSVHTFPLSPLARTPSPSAASPARSPSPLAVPQGHQGHQQGHHHQGHHHQGHHQVGSSHHTQQTIPALHSGPSCKKALHTSPLTSGLHLTSHPPHGPHHHPSTPSSHHPHPTHSPLSKSDNLHATKTAFHRPKSCEPTSSAPSPRPLTSSPERLHPSHAVTRPEGHMTRPHVTPPMGMDKLPPPHRKVSLQEKRTPPPP